MSKTKSPAPTLAEALAPLPFTPHELALVVTYSKVALPEDPRPAGSGWQIAIAEALVDRLARTNPDAAETLRSLLAFASVTAVVASAATRDANLRRMRAAITGEDAEALRPKKGQAA
jgi:hypothetical protein